jgi:hypothetical protein
MSDRLTWRELRLLDWMRAPHHPTLPQDPAIDLSAALWKVSDLVRLSGVTLTYNYARCRRDLDALNRHKLVTQLVPGYWMQGDRYA